MRDRKIYRKKVKDLQKESVMKEWERKNDTGKVGAKEKERGQERIWQKNRGKGTEKLWERKERDRDAERKKMRDS